MANEVLVQEEKDVEAARQMGATTVSRAMELAKAIRDSMSLNAAADFLIEIKRRRKQWAEWNKPAKQKLDALKKELLERERQIDEPMERSENEILKPAISQFQEEQDRIRRQQEDKLRAEAKKREEDARLKEAQELSDDGHKELADAILEAPIVVAPIVIPRIDNPSGIQFRELWKFEVVDPNSVPREYLMVDEKKIGAIARALKGETNIPGVRVYSEKSVAGRV